MNLFCLKKFLIVLKNSNKKNTVNRKKSRNIKKKTVIIGGVAILITVGFFCFKNNIKNSFYAKPATETISEDDIEKLIKKTHENKIEKESNFEKEKIEEEITKNFSDIVNINNNIDESPQNESTFYLEFNRNKDLGALTNAETYREYYEYYGKMYGVDPNILALISAQESSGGINILGEKATGVTQISDDWVYKYGPITVTNYYTNQKETLKINSKDELLNPETCIKMSAAICQYHLRVIKEKYSGISDDKAILATIAAYFWGPGENAVNEANNVSKKEYNYLEGILKRAEGLSNNTLYMYHDSKTYQVTIELTNTNNYTRA